MGGHVTLLALVLSLVTGITVISSLPVRAEEPVQKVARVAVVDPGSPSTTTADFKAFYERLRELGYVEGANLVIEARFADGRFDQLPALTAEVLTRNVDVLVTLTSPAAIAAKNATGTVPIVATMMGDPVGTGLAASLAHPGSNLTGLTHGWGPGIASKWLELLHETVSNLSTVAVTANLDIPWQRDLVKELMGTAATRGLRIRLVEVHNPQGLDHAFQLARRSAQAVLVLADPITVNNRTRVTMLVAKHRLPAMYGLRDFVDVGGLMAYAVDQVAMFRRAADYVDMILKGAKPAELPIEQPTQYRLILNLRTAKALGLTFPESILLRADEVIQ